MAERNLVQDSSPKIVFQSDQNAMTPVTPLYTMADYVLVQTTAVKIFNLNDMARYFTLRLYFHSWLTKINWPAHEVFRHIIL